MRDSDIKAIDEITYEIQKRVGIYAYAVFDDDKKRWIGEAVLGGLSFGLLKDYISAFLDIKSIGARHRTYVSELIARIRAGETSFDTRIEPVWDDVEQARQSLAGESDSAAVFQAGEARLAMALTELRMPPGEAAELAREIAEKVKPLFK